jgi:type II secretion system (T2SS) protein E
MSGGPPPRPEDEALALAFDSGLPFAGLRDHEHDPALDRVVPPAAARAARVVPLAADGERVRLAAATAQPDLRALDTYLGERRVELAIAPPAEIEAILGPPPPPAEVAAAEPEPEEPARPERQPPEPEPADAAEEPSWLEPPRRSRRRVVVAIVVVLLLALAAAAYVLTR